MAETANQVLYRQELVKTFERRYAVLEPRVTTEGIASGSQFVFLVNGSGGRSAVTRGINGKIPNSANDDTQVTITMAEWHDKPQTTHFNIFAGQAGAKRRAAMQEESIGVLNRKADDIVLDALATSTNYAGLAASTLDLNKITHAMAVLGNNVVSMNPNDVTFLITPAARSYLLQTTEATSIDYVKDQMLIDAPEMFRFAGAMFIVHHNLPGKGTNNERLFCFHRSALGLARDRENMNVGAGYNDEDHYYFARSSMYMGAVLLQNAGVVSVRHDGSAMAATA